MHFFKQNCDPAIYFNGKAYPTSVYMQAYNEATHDKQLEKEIDALEKKYIQLHLDMLMNEQDH